MEKVYEKVIREAIWQILRMYNISGKLLNGIKSMYVNSLACLRVKGVEIFQNLKYCEARLCHAPLALYCVYGCSDERSENGAGENGSEVSGGGETVKIACPLVCR